MGWKFHRTRDQWLGSMLPAVAVLLCLDFAASGQVERGNIDMAYVTQQAEDRARSPFHSPRAELPAVLRQDKLNYDNYRKIRFRKDRDFWAGAGLPFRVEFFAPGYIYQEPVHIYEFTNNFVQRIRFVRDWFDYGGLNIEDQIPADTGYAGFKVFYQLNTPGAFDEVASFLGASYFRMLGQGQRYGASARGLAIDCGETDRPEEFPIFTDFWLEKPGPKSTTLHFFALLDSVSCTGAYDFHVTPGETTTCDVDAVMFLREPAKAQAADKQWQPLKTIGFAPLTSMFWFGENSERKFDDYRPGVHDSDGLLLSTTNGELMWRPLDNPVKMQHAVFSADNVKGFGLLQRERDFSSYDDMFNPYQLVPAIWVKPKGGWGEGDVHLVELPTGYEGLDNIVAFWSPKKIPAPMQPVHISYQLLWTREIWFQLSPNRVVSTRIGLDGTNTDKRQAQIEFSGPALDPLLADKPPEVVTSCGANARIYGSQIVKDPYTGGWRVVLKFEPAAGDTDPVELRCALKVNGKQVSETWSYLWSPP